MLAVKHSKWYVCQYAKKLAQNFLCYFKTGDVKTASDFPCFMDLQVHQKNQIDLLRVSIFLKL